MTAADSAPTCRQDADEVPFELLLRLFTHAGDAERAAVLERRLLTVLAPFAPRPVAPPEPYWKEPGWFEHYHALAPADRATFAAVVGLAAATWDVVGDIEEPNAVWNPAPGQVFLLPEVAWAEVNLLRPNPPSPDQEYEPL